MLFAGNIRKMRSELLNEVAYQLPLFHSLEPKELIDMTDLVGQTIRIEFQNEINCVVTGKKIKKAINYFYGTHNFSAFRSSSCSAKSPIKKITKASVKKIAEKIVITFESKSFLQKQVRSMVGCLKYVGENKWKPEKIKLVIKSKKRKLCAPPAPAEGLYLKKVFY